MSITHSNIKYYFFQFWYLHDSFIFKTFHEIFFILCIVFVS